MNTTTNFLRHMVLSAIPLLCAYFMVPVPASAQIALQTHEAQSQETQPYEAQSRNVARGPNAAAAYLRTVGFARSAWYSLPGQQPKLHFTRDEVRITLRKHSTVLLGRVADGTSSAAEVSLVRAPISTSSISGLAVYSDAQHALVIGLEGGSVVLWQLDPNATRVLARQAVNASSPLEFRVVESSAANPRFFWRHRGGEVWHPLKNTTSATTLIGWREPMRFGLLLDGPRGSQVTFGNYRAGDADVAYSSLAALPVSGR